MPQSKGRARTDFIPKYKLVFIGDENVGKTSILARFVGGTFDNHYEATIGVDFLTRNMYKSNGHRVKLQLWDTAGQERFRSLIKSYIRNTHCACLVFDVTRQTTLQNIEFWHQKVSEYCVNFDNIHVVLIANKCDLDSRRTVTMCDIKETAYKLGIDHFVEISALSGMNIDALFQQIVDRLPDSQPDIAKVVKLEDNEENQATSGCACELL